MISVPNGTGDIADAMIFTPQMIYASRMKGTDIISYLQRKYIIRFCRISYRASDISLKKIRFYDIINAPINKNLQGGDFVSKSYSFEFSGTKEMFLNQLNKYNNNNQRFFYFDDYIVECSDDDIRFGVARGGHSGGYWFVPTITELDGKTIFCGSIEHSGAYTSQKGIKKILNKIEEVFLWIMLIPFVIIVKVCLFFSWIVRKIFKRTKPKEESLEDKLHNLMENYLNCKLIQ